MAGSGLAVNALKFAGSRVICSKVLESESVPFSELTTGTDATTTAESVRDAIWSAKSARSIPRADRRRSVTTAVANPAWSTVI